MGAYWKAPPELAFKIIADGQKWQAIGAANDIKITLRSSLNTLQNQQVRDHYKTLLRLWGRQHWWPARTRFEVIVGAYLTQNTSWRNVEKALRQLRLHETLTVKGVRNISLRDLEQMIRAAGYFRQKAQRLKTFVAFLDASYGGSLNRMFATPAVKLRQELLQLNGVGPETADSILLYAGQQPVFVVDAYTRRILDRHGIMPERAAYDKIREFLESALQPLAIERAQTAPRADELLKPAGAPGACHPPSPMSLAKRPGLVQVYNEMHGLIVGVGKNYCLKTNPRCDICPLRKFLPVEK